jgi:Mg2+ and Co2+ transporter CorA
VDHYIGKESNRLEDVEAGTVHDLEEVLTEYRDPDRDDWTEVVLPVLREVPKADLAAATRIHPRKVAAIRNGHARPRRDHRAALMVCAGTFAKERLREAGLKPLRDDVAACRRYIELRSADSK